MADIQQIIANLTGQGDAVKFANELSSDLYPGEGYLKRGDALRHMLWQAKLQQKYGSLPAALAGHVYELAGAMEGQEGNESDMDLHNNEIGRRIGKESTNDADLVGKALQEIVEGRAKHYADGGLVDSALSDYSQLLDAYPNANKFLSALKSSVASRLPSQEDLKDPNKMMDVAMNFGPSNLASGLAGVIKQKGGNWFGGSNSPEAAAQILKSGPVLPQYETAKDSLNNWIDQKLAKYIRNDLGTPEDPIRALAEKGILHVNPENVISAEWAAKNNRYFAGLPQENMALSDLAKKWEDAADSKITGVRRGYVSEADRSKMPWLDKLSPEETIYRMDLPFGLGFEHMRDELRNATRYDSDLPANLRIAPEKLSKVSVPQAVELVSKINQYRADKMAEENIAKAMNPATHTFKEYTENNPKGLRWVELKSPEGAESIKALEDALKYEGDTMGHCVGGYCPDVTAGRSRIFSLRDQKGQPHVTIETRPDPGDLLDYDVMDSIMNHMSESQQNKFNKWVDSNDGNFDNEDLHGWLKQNAKRAYDKVLKSTPTEQIYQIKGKQNLAPKEEYLPFVQDFVKSGNWSHIRDLENARMKRDELGNLQAYAQGGHVEMNPDTINNIMQQFESEYGLRPDRSEKGRGYLNELKRPDGGVMTEYSIGIPVQGVEMDVPTLVPTLNIEEIKTLLSLPERGRIPESIVKKAAEHAESRVKAGKPVFATPQESEFGEK